MAKWRRQRSGQSVWGRNPFVQKSTEELLQMKADLEARLIPIEAELADLAVRQAAAEPVVQRLASQLAEKRQAAQQLRCDPKSYVLGGVLGLGHKATVKEQLQLLYQECRQLEAELAKASQGGSLGNLNLLFTLPPRRLDYIWHEQRENVARERKKWQIDRDLAFVAQLLSRRFNAQEEERREANRAARQAIVRAKVAAHDGKSRDLTSAVKKTLPPQTECPYCGGSLGANPHADHIYPVTKGGHSVAENMVLVCAACNLKKGSKTLRAFIVEHGLSRDEIEKRLHALGKDF